MDDEKLKQFYDPVIDGNLLIKLKEIVCSLLPEDYKNITYFPNNQTYIDFGFSYDMDLVICAQIYAVAYYMESLPKGDQKINALSENMERQVVDKVVSQYKHMDVKPIGDTHPSHRYFYPLVFTCNAIIFFLSQQMVKSDFKIKFNLYFNREKKTLNNLEFSIIDTIYSILLCVESDTDDEESAAVLTRMLLENFTIYDVILNNETYMKSYLLWRDLNNTTKKKDYEKLIKNNINDYPNIDMVAKNDYGWIDLASKSSDTARFSNAVDLTSLNKKEKEFVKAAYNDLNQYVHAYYNNSQITKDAIYSILSMSSWVLFKLINDMKKSYGDDINLIHNGEDLQQRLEAEIKETLSLARKTKDYWNQDEIVLHYGPVTITSTKDSKKRKRNDNKESSQQDH